MDCRQVALHVLHVVWDPPDLDEAVGGDSPETYLALILCRAEPRDFPPGTAPRTFFSMWPMMASICSRSRSGWSRRASKPSSPSISTIIQYTAASAPRVDCFSR